MQIIILLIPFILLLINYFTIAILSVTIIFLLMRIYSAYICKAQFNLSTFVYIFYIPELITGPFRDYPTWSKKETRKLFSESLINVLNSLILILLSGYFYSKTIFFYDNIFYTSVITYLVLYAQFHSMSKIANSISMFLGKTEVVNFNNPLMATSINDFWSRWHISLGVFAKKYINQPLTFYVSKKIKNKNLPYVLSIFITFLFIGLWHNVSYNYLIFGIYFGIIVILERHFLDRLFSKIANIRLQKLLGILYAQSAHIIGFSFVVEYIQKIIIHP
ncbi:MAG: MBOAT family O-acyltransferase [Campylobacterota bacterium]|nr:MBOAT family O-acyltransferase [Campylobacterota bacterium]